jgi:transposase
VRAAGAEVFKAGLPSGVSPETIASIRETRVALKGPLETPVGFGEKSANVTLRKLFETYANVRPVREMPGVATPFAGRDIDLVIVRENVEGLYAGIEHMQTPGVAQCLKIMSKKGCERIVRLAFELAVAAGARLEKACEVLGLSGRTVERWRAEDDGGRDGRDGPKHAPPHELSAAEKAKILRVANSPEFRDKSPRQIVPTLSDRGEYVASESNFYRVLKEAGQLAHRGRAQRVAALPNATPRTAGRQHRLGAPAPWLSVPR